MRKLTIDVAEATCFALLCVVETASPVHGDVALAAVQPCGTLHAASSADTAELEQTVKDGTVVADVVPALLLGEVLEEADVERGVVGDQHAPLGELEEGRQGRVDRR